MRGLQDHVLPCFTAYRVKHGSLRHTPEYIHKLIIKKLSDVNKQIGAEGVYQCAIWHNPFKKYLIIQERL